MLANKAGMHRPSDEALALLMPTMGDVARQTQLKIPTIRFYEAEGLLAAPPRSPNGRRQYSEADIRRLTFIRRARELGFELSDVRTLLDLNDQPGQVSASARKIVQEYLDTATKRIAQLNRLKRGLVSIARSRQGGHDTEQRLIEALVERTRRTFEQRDKGSVSPARAATLGYAMQRQATGGNAKVGPETRTFAYDTMRRLIDQNPEFEKLFVARGLRHPQPEVRWRKKP